MREPLEMVTASRMQNMVEITFSKKKRRVCWGLSALRAPTVGPFADVVVVVVVVADYVPLGG